MTGKFLIEDDEIITWNYQGKTIEISVRNKLRDVGEWIRNVSKWYITYVSETQWLVFIV